MTERPRIIYILTALWLSLSAMFLIWGAYSLNLVLQIPGWQAELSQYENLVPMLHFGFLMATIVWFVFSSVYILIAYATFKKDSWAWSTGIIISTIFLVVFFLMLASFMINAVLFLDWFSVLGLVAVILTVLIDLGVVFFITRPATKMYFEVQ